jgi:lipoyl synthase
MTPPVAEGQSLTQGQTDLVQIDLSPKRPVKKPEWLKAKAPMGETFHALKKMARSARILGSAGIRSRRRS